MAEPYIDDSGQHVGWVVTADDGETYLSELDGEIVAVWDDDGQGWDLDIAQGYTFADQGDPYEQRIAELEQRVNEPRPVSEITVARAVEETDMQSTNEDMLRQREQAETMIGRHFTLRERRLIGNEMLNDVQAGRHADISAAIERLELRGEDLPDLDHENPNQAREARVRHMTELWQDHDRIAAANRGEDDLLDDEPPATSDQYDVDDRQQRQAWMVDAMRGATDASALYSSDEDRESTRWEE